MFAMLSALLVPAAQAQASPPQCPPAAPVSYLDVAEAGIYVPVVGIREDCDVDPKALYFSYSTGDGLPSQLLTAVRSATEDTCIQQLVLPGAIPFGTCPTGCREQVTIVDATTVVIGLREGFDCLPVLHTPDAQDRCLVDLDCLVRCETAYEAVLECDPTEEPPLDPGDR